MKVPRIFCLVFFAASLLIFFSSPAKATDHPWDDSAIDTSHSTGSNVGDWEGSETDTTTVGPTTDHTTVQVIIQRFNNWMSGFIKSFFVLERKYERDMKADRVSTGKSKGSRSVTKYK